MLEFARKASTFMQGKSRHDLDDDELLSLAIVRLLEILGEAARRVSTEYRDRTPGFPGGRSPARGIGLSMPMTPSTMTSSSRS